MDKLINREREYIYCFSGSLQNGRNIRLLHRLSQHNIRLLGQPPHREAGYKHFTDGE